MTAEKVQILVYGASALVFIGIVVMVTVFWHLSNKKSRLLQEGV